MEYREELVWGEQMMLQIKPAEFLVENSSLEPERVKNQGSISEL